MSMEVKVYPLNSDSRAYNIVTFSEADSIYINPAQVVCIEAYTFNGTCEFKAEHKKGEYKTTKMFKLSLGYNQMRYIDEDDKKKIEVLLK